MTARLSPHAARGLRGAAIEAEWLPTGALRLQVFHRELDYHGLQGRKRGATVVLTRSEADDLRRYLDDAPKHDYPIARVSRRKV